MDKNLQFHNLGNNQRIYLFVKRPATERNDDFDSIVDTKTCLLSKVAVRGTGDTVNIILILDLDFKNIKAFSQGFIYFKNTKFSKTCSVSSNWPATVPGHRILQTCFGVGPPFSKAERKNKNRTIDNKF